MKTPLAARVYGGPGESGQFGRGPDARPAALVESGHALGPRTGWTLPAEPVVVGVNGSAGSAAALRWAADEAWRRQTGLRIVSARREPDPGSPGRACLGEQDRIVVMRVQRAPARVLRQHHFPRRITCVTPHTAAGRALLAEAGDTGLLILGIMPVGAGPVSGPTGRYCLRHRRGLLVFVPARPSHDAAAASFPPRARHRTGAGTSVRSDLEFSNGLWCVCT